MYICVRCNKSSETKYPEDQNSDLGIFCDCCENLFCSNECAQVEDVQIMFPGCCPGVYHCIVCREQYLNWSKGHIFIPYEYLSKEDKERLKLYYKIRDYGSFPASKCLHCGIFCGEYESETDQ